MKNNLFANVLLVLIGLLLLLAALQMFGWGRGSQTLEAETFDLTSLSQLEVNAEDTNADNIDEKDLERITDAPLFSFDRQPFVPTEEDLEIVETPEIVAEPLKAKVTSIIIIEENSYAMVFDEMSKESITLTKGMPLPGEQGLWTVDTINPRAVTFIAEGEEPVEIGLDVFDGQLNANANRNNRANKNRNKTKNVPARNADKAEIEKQQTQKNSAEEIRRKIAERRAQMRANAAKGNKE